MLRRPRRNRKSEWVRSTHRETTLNAGHFIYPLFIHGGAQDIPIKSMPGCERLSPDGLMREVEGALGDGVGAVVLFPAIDDALKTALA